MTVREATEGLKRMLAAVGGEDAAVDARELVSLAIGRRVSRADAQAELTAEQEGLLEAAAKRRLSGEPLQYIIGEWDFMGLTFSVSPAVLIPRQDTETLAEEAERLIRERGYATLLDLCTGSGCIGIALQRRTGIAATLADISPDALAVAAKNAERNGVNARILRSDMFSALTDQRFDMITVNPPYIPTRELKSLQREVRQEPALALDGGADGLDFYRRIAAEFGSHLNAGGALLAEIGFDQGERVCALLEGAGEVRLLKDLAGHDRVVAVELR